MSEQHSFVVWAAVETAEGHTDHDGALAAMALALDVGGGAAIEAGGDQVAAGFGEASAAAEAAIVGQWNAQRLDGETPKLRVGVGDSEDSAAALAEAANGNQILMSAAVDLATGGMLDARPIGLVTLPGADESSQLWLMTDSRPDVDRRPPRLDHLREQ